MNSTRETMLVILLVISLIGTFPIVADADGEGWLDGWGNRMSITITPIYGYPAGTDYQIFLNVTHQFNMQSDFDDLRFTDNNGETELDYWMENYTASTFAIVWVEVNDSLDTAKDIYMYYGNSIVSTTSDGEATFLLFDDFEDNNFDNWADTANMQTTAVRTHDGSSFSASWIASGSNAIMQDNTYAGLSGIRVSFWNNIDDTLRGSFIYVYSEDDYSENVATVRSTYETDTSPIYYRDTGVYVPYPSSADNLNDDEWDKIEFAVDFDSDIMQTWQNGVANGQLAIVEDDGSILETEEVDGIGLQMQSGNQVWFDDVIVRKYVSSEPVAVFNYEYEWNLNDPARVIFSVAFDMWGYNIALVILGLIMIPVSTIYLAYGAKHDRSSDRLFYGLILFMLGCGLFIGGILP